MSQSTICRLCLKACNNDSSSIYNADGRPNGIYDMMLDLFHPKIVDMEAAKHLTDICGECFRHIHDFHSFQTSVVMAQLNLIEKRTEMTVKMEPEVVSPKLEEWPGDNETTGEEERSLKAETGATVCPTFQYAPVGEHNDAIVKPELEIMDVNGQSEYSSDGIDGSASEEFLTDDSNSGDINLNAEDDVSFDTEPNQLLKTTPPTIAGETEPEPENVTDSNPKDKLTVADDNIAHVKKKKFNCDICHISYGCHKTLRKHLRKLHPGILPHMFSPDYDATTKSFKCKLCGKLMAKKCHLVLHMRRQHGTPDADRSLVKVTPNKYKCTACGMSYTNLRSLKKHMNEVHSLDYSANNKNITKKLKCNICDSSYSTDRGLAKHLRKYHPGVLPSHFDPAYDATTKRFKCEHCNNTFPYLGNLTTHIRMWHSDQAGGNSDSPAAMKSIQCKLCDNSYGTAKSLSRHMMQQHPGNHLSMFSSNYDATTKSFKCKFCGKTFLQNRFLVCHMRHRHRNEGDDGIDLSKSEYANREEAVKSPSESDARENLTDSQSKDDVDLADGSLVPHANKDLTKKLNCDICDTSYGSDATLRRHLKKHHPGIQAYMFSPDYDVATKSFKCKLCGNLMAKKCHLVLHMRRQHGNPDADPSAVNETQHKFKCTSCTLSYTNQVSLKKHMKQIHGIQHIAIKMEFNFVYDETTKRYVCKECGSSYESRLFFVKHMEKMHPETRQTASNSDQQGSSEMTAAPPPPPEEPFKCDICDKSYMFESFLKTHMKRLHSGDTSHSDSQPRNAFHCQLCDSKTFWFRDDLRLHMKRQHWDKRDFNYDDTTKIFKCKLCDRTDATWSGMIAHLAQEHGKPSQANYKCGKCRKKFLIEEDLERHYTDGGNCNNGEQAVA